MWHNLKCKQNHSILKYVKISNFFRNNDFSIFGKTYIILFVLKRSISLSLIYIWDRQPSVFPELVGFWWDRWGVSDVATYLVSYRTGEIATWDISNQARDSLPGLKGFWSDIWASVLYIKQKSPISDVTDELWEVFRFDRCDQQHLTWSVGGGQRRWVEFGPLCAGGTHIQ